MNSFQRYVLALAGVLVAMIFLLDGLGIIRQPQTAKELVLNRPSLARAPLLVGRETQSATQPFVASRDQGTEGENLPAQWGWLDVEKNPAGEEPFFS
jgi:hypothetical protein